MSKCAPERKKSTFTECGHCTLVTIHLESGRVVIMTVTKMIPMTTSSVQTSWTSGPWLTCVSVHGEHEHPLGRM